MHLDHHLAGIVEKHGRATYGILWGIVFCETGLVITPFLPGQSMSNLFPTKSTHLDPVLPLHACHSSLDSDILIISSAHGTGLSLHLARHFLSLMVSGGMISLNYRHCCPGPS